MSMIESMAQAVTWRRRRAESLTNGGRNILGRWLPHRRGGVKLCANRNPPAVQRRGGPWRPPTPVAVAARPPQCAGAATVRIERSPLPLGSQDQPVDEDDHADDSETGKGQIRSLRAGEGERRRGRGELGHAPEPTSSRRRPRSWRPCTRGTQSARVSRHTGSCSSGSWVRLRELSHTRILRARGGSRRGGDPSEESLDQCLERSA